ncbi:hypothetical protein [Streptomyces sp. MA15]|uniref:hypothetical protein n=1 Tax=Streptomyces sp. MA15 TaxID=3055061 RepID=UPI0025AF8DFA|nr:hypothetical protein [Streptomyces sp. MA15]MDN3271558.1 hypothetical protein [Streptomyces sp. MA15]
MSIGIDDVRAFIRQLPDAAAVAQVQEAAARRLGELDKAAHDGIVAGRRARISDSLRPVFLRRLTGTVQERNRTGTRAGFLLDEGSTRLLRTDPRNRYRIPEGTKRFRLPGNGVPVSCLELIEG